MPAKVAIRPDPHVQAVVEQSREAEMLRAKAMDEAMGAVRHSRSPRLGERSRLAAVGAAG